MNWSAFWTAIKPVLVTIITRLVIPLLIGSAGAVATYHASK